MYKIDAILIALWVAKPGGQEIGVKEKIKEYFKLNGMEVAQLLEVGRLLILNLADEERAAGMVRQIEESLKIIKDS